tara:strand:+ start:2671 stop:3261 length:591 start_codon:yes stop_codon:yes gene_type:complete
MATLFDDILLKGIRSGQIPARTQRSRDWFREQARRTTTSGNQVIRAADNAQYKRSTSIGSMYLFQYDAKHKKTLPYFDKFPLIFPIGFFKGRMIGMNFHYLPLKHRAILMDALYETANNDRFDQRTKLVISYDILKASSKFKFFAPTVHSYLSPQVRSRFVLIPSAEWDIAMYLPIASFSGASVRKVWADTRAKLR